MPRAGVSLNPTMGTPSGQCPTATPQGRHSNPMIPRRAGPGPNTSGHAPSLHTLPRQVQSGTQRVCSPKVHVPPHLVQHLLQDAKGRVGKLSHAARHAPTYRCTQPVLEDRKGLGSEPPREARDPGPSCVTAMLCTVCPGGHAHPTLRSKTRPGSRVETGGRRPISPRVAKKSQRGSKNRK